MTILERLTKNLAKLPGIGSKSASRLAYYLLKAEDGYLEVLSRDIKELKQKIKNCTRCGNYTESDPCSICTDGYRNQNLICIVEEPRDILAIESVHEYQGVYHVLMGALSPIDGVGPEDLTIAKLIKRVAEQTPEEIILATNPTVEGDTTALFITNALKDKQIKITRLALGLPVGGDLEYSDRLTIARAFKGRNPI